MKLTVAIQLAFRNMIHDRRRLAAAVTGIAFAVVLIFMQIGFMYALFDSTVKLLDELDADLILASPARYALAAPQQFDLRRLKRAESCPEVAAAYPLYLERVTSYLKPLPAGKAHAIRVVGIPLAANLFYPETQIEAGELLREPQTALIDLKSKQQPFGFATSRIATERVHAELAGQKIQLVGSLLLGTDFVNEGTLVMSQTNFARYFPWRAVDGSDPLQQVDLGIVQVTAGASVAQTRQALTEILGNDVLVLSKQDYRAREVEFWRRSTPIGMIFQIGTWMGFIVGIIICYQVIFTDVADHISELATLKAMGYSQAFFLALIIAESIFLSLAGFGPGLLVSWGIYQVLAESTGLLMNLTWMRAVFVLGMTVLMCICSGLLALRKLLAADPAALY